MEVDEGIRSRSRGRWPGLRPVTDPAAIRRSLSALCGVILATVLLGSAAGSAAAEQQQATFAPGRVLVGFESDATPGEQRAVEGAEGVRGSQSLVDRADLAATRSDDVSAASERRVDRIGPILAIDVRPGNEKDVAARLADAAGVRFAEPDYLLESAATPNDPDLGQQWAIRNTGQTVNGLTGTPGADENAIPAWDVTTGSSNVVVAVVDTGVDYNHPDLAANIWDNPDGIGGCPVGSHGVDTVGAGPPTCDPMDEDLQYNGHGTHVAGILGASGNNEIGVAGLNWSLTMLPVKFVDASGGGRTSDLIEGLQWLLDAKQDGVNLRIVNDSQTFVGTSFSQATSDMIDMLGANDILFVTAAGDTGDDNDDPAVRRYPCGYGRPNEICVAYTDSRDRLPAAANYGDETVDLAAPGRNIYSTLPDASPTDPGPNYGFLTGASMAAPQVSGTAALILATGDRSATKLKSLILDHVDPLPSLAGKVRTGGRLDVCNAIPACNPDDDGDGVFDADDACPTLAGGGTASGCPRAARTLTLAYDAASGRFNGALDAPSAQGCESGRQVTLWRQQPGADQVAGSASTVSGGAYSVDAPAEGGTYYAEADPETIVNVADCARATSETVDNCNAIPACNPDDDGDGVFDADDACPTLAGGGTASGCPRARGSVGLRYLKHHERFAGRLRYRTASGCRSGRVVTLWKRNRGQARKLARTESRRNGKFRIASSAKPGRYYVKVRHSVAAGEASCARTKSRRIAVR
jgi:subtilisin family serine protease